MLLLTGDFPRVPNDRFDGSSMIDGIDDPDVHSVYRVYLVGAWMERTYQNTHKVNLCHNTYWWNINSLICELRECIFTDKLPLIPALTIQLGDLYFMQTGVCGAQGVACVQLPKPRVDAYGTSQLEPYAYVQDSLYYTKEFFYHNLLPDSGNSEIELIGDYLYEVQSDENLALNIPAYHPSYKCPRNMTNHRYGLRKLILITAA